MWIYIVHIFYMYNTGLASCYKLMFYTVCSGHVLSSRSCTLSSQQFVCSLFSQMLRYKCDAVVFHDTSPSLPILCCSHSILQCHHCFCYILSKLLWISHSKVYYVSTIHGKLACTQFNLYMWLMRHSKSINWNVSLIFYLDNGP